MISARINPPAGESKVYRLLYLNKKGMHVREISRAAGVTIPAIIRHINAGETAGTITSETRGRLKICRLNFRSPKLVPVIYETELARFQEIPPKMRDAFDSFITDLQEKPLLAAIFGSVARKEHTQKSDLDILLVFQRVDDKLMRSVESSAAKIRGRTTVDVQPAGISFEEFEKGMLDVESEFMGDIRKDALVMRGLETYTDLLGRFYR